MLPFEDRTSAGRQLAAALSDYSGRDDVVALGLPRGGVPVAREVAAALDAPLDVFLVRKLGVPGHEELAMGAIASGGARVMNPHVVRQLGIDEATIARVAEAERAELERRERVYRNERAPAPIQGRIAILIDDGLATGASMRAAVSAVRSLEPTEAVVAVPVAPPETCALMEQEADRAVCVEMPEPFGGVGRWYRQFEQLTDAQVQEILEAMPAGASAR